MTEPLSSEEIDEHFAAEIARLHAENATLRKEREYRCADLEAANAENAKLRERVGRLEAVARAVWDSIPATYDDTDAMVQRHAKALNALAVALAACDEEDSK